MVTLRMKLEGNDLLDRIIFILQLIQTIGLNLIIKVKLLFQLKIRSILKKFPVSGCFLPGKIKSKI